MIERVVWKEINSGDAGASTEENLFWACLNRDLGVRQDSGHPVQGEERIPSPEVGDEEAEQHSRGKRRSRRLPMWLILLIQTPKLRLDLHPNIQALPPTLREVHMMSD